MNLTEEIQKYRDTLNEKLLNESAPTLYEFFKVLTLTFGGVGGAIAIVGELHDWITGVTNHPFGPAKIIFRGGVIPKKIDELEKYVSLTSNPEKAEKQIHRLKLVYKNINHQLENRSKKENAAGLSVIKESFLLDEAEIIDFESGKSIEKPFEAPREKGIIINGPPVVLGNDANRFILFVINLGFKLKENAMSDLQQLWSKNNIKIIFDEEQWRIYTASYEFITSGDYNDAKRFRETIKNLLRSSPGKILKMSSKVEESKIPDEKLQHKLDDSGEECVWCGHKNMSSEKAMTVCPVRKKKAKVTEDTIGKKPISKAVAQTGSDLAERAEQASKEFDWANEKAVKIQYNKNHQRRKGRKAELEIKIAKKELELASVKMRKLMDEEEKFSKKTGIHCVDAWEAIHNRRWPYYKVDSGHGSIKYYVTESISESLLKEFFNDYQEEPDPEDKYDVRNLEDTMSLAVISGWRRDRNVEEYLKEPGTTVFISPDKSQYMLIQTGGAWEIQDGNSNIRAEGNDAEELKIYFRRNNIMTPKSDDEEYGDYYDKAFKWANRISESKKFKLLESKVKVLKAKLKALKEDTEDEGIYVIERKPAKADAEADGWVGKGYILTNPKYPGGKLYLFKDDGYVYHPEGYDTRDSEYGETWDEFHKFLKNVPSIKLKEKFTDPKAKKVFNVISDLAITRVVPEDVQDMRFYYLSPVRLCVFNKENLGWCEAWFKNGMQNLRRTGFKTVKELGELLRAQGVKQVKKPKPYKSTPPLYD